MVEEIIGYAMSCLIIITYIFPAENGGTFDTVNVPDSVIACGHLAVIGFAFHNIDTGIRLERWT